MEWDPDGRQDDQVYQDPEEEGDEAEKEAEGHHSLACDEGPLLHLVSQRSPPLNATKVQVKQQKKSLLS